MYTLKQGVSIFISPEIEKMLDAICLVYASFHIPVVVTSGLDGPHREGSLHFCFRAFDIRKCFPSTIIESSWQIHKEMIFEALQHQFRIRKLPVVMVNEQDHIHFEWNGK